MKTFLKHRATHILASAAIAAGSTVGIVDLSNNNGPGAAAAIAHHSVIAKATEGLGFHDYLYPRFRQTAKRYGSAFGGYMFLHPDESGAAQADYFLAYARPRPGDIQPVVDSEIGSPCSAGPATLAALKELQRHGFKPILYSNTYWLSSFHAYCPAIARALGRFRVWQAEYGPTLHQVPGFHDIAWQFTDQAHVAGLSVDGSHLMVRSIKQLLVPRHHHHRCGK